MKTIKGTDFHPVQQWWSYEVKGNEYTVNGEMYLNREKNRYEHIHIGPRGGETLVVWYRNSKYNKSR